MRPSIKRRLDSGCCAHCGRRRGLLPRSCDACAAKFREAYHRPVDAASPLPLKNNQHARQPVYRTSKAPQPSRPRKGTRAKPDEQRQRLEYCKRLIVAGALPWTEIACAVADAFSLSPRSAERVLKAAYRKLGITGRHGVTADCHCGNAAAPVK